MFGQTWVTLPRLVRFLIVHFADGAVLGCILGLILIRTDTGGIGTLLESHRHGGPTALFFAQGALLFGTLASAVAVVNLDDGTD
jgi:hypothetical protein